MTSAPTSTAVDWAAVLAVQPRERFIPDRIWRHDPGRDGNDLLPVDRTREPERWAAMVAADRPVITQVDGGRPAADGTGMEATSSASDRRVVADMLALLDARPGERVLEIGTGTGWNAALLAAAGVSVTTVEIDPDVARDARGRLGEAAEVITGDGARGWPAGAPFDAVIATVGVSATPWPWIVQTRSGGRLVVPLTHPWYPLGLARLTRAAAGAQGRLHGPANFMGLRAEATPRVRARGEGEPRWSHTELHPFYVYSDRAAAVAVGRRTRDVAATWTEDEAGGALRCYADRSWARVQAVDDPPYRVAELGPRSLWGEVEAAYWWWVEQGKPGVEAWRVTVDRDGQRVELR